MKKVLSILLSVLLLLSTMAVLTILPAVATTTTVAITAADGGYVNTDSVEYGVESTVTATPYYGNTFAGWYDANGLVSANSTYTGVINNDLTAQFNVYNMIDDGNFESGTEAMLNSFSISDYENSMKISVADVPADFKTAVHGEKALYVDSSFGTHRNTIGYALKIPFTVKKNQSYVLHYSLLGTDANKSVYFGFHGITQQLWNPVTTLDKYTFRFNTENVTTGVTGAVRSYATRGAKDHRLFQTTPTNVVNPTTGWVDFVVVFDAGEDTSIFPEGEDTANVFFTIGYGNDSYNNITYDATKDASPNFYIDNVSLTEASDAVSANISVVADANGTVTKNTVQKPLAAAKYWNTTAYAGDGGDGNVNLANEADYDTNAPMYEDDSDTTTLLDDYYYSSIETTAGSYTATANDGYAFDGWYDANGQLVSTNATENFYTEGTYTAKFASAPTAGEGGYLIDNGDGTVTAKAYFGNSFLGWYKHGSPVSTEVTIKSEDFMGAVATFDKYNLIDNGDMEDGDATVINNSTSTGSTEIKTEDNGNKYLRMSSTTTGTSFYSFQWTYALEQGKKYIISYDMRPGFDSNGYLSSKGMSYRRLIVHDNGGRKYDWCEIGFTNKMAYTIGPKQTFSDTAVLLPPGGTDCYPLEGSTSFADNFRYSTDEWVNYSTLIDTTTATVTKDADGDGTKETVSIVNEDGTIDLGLCFGANTGGTLSLDIDNIVISEYVDEYEKAQSTGGYATISRRASTPVLPVVYTAHSNDGYQFAGWYNADDELVSKETVATFKTAGKYTAKFEPLSSISSTVEDVEENAVINTSAIDTDDYFIPYGSVYHVDDEGNYIFADKNEDGTFTAPVAGTFNFTGFKNPSAGRKLITFGASTHNSDDTVQYGSYVPSTEDGTTYGTMFITGDWDAFVKYYQENKSWTVDEIVAKVSAMYDSKISGFDGYVPISAGTEISVFVYKVDQKRHMYKNESGILEYTLRVIGLGADRTCTAVGYAKTESSCEFSENIISTSYNELNGAN